MSLKKIKITLSFSLGILFMLFSNGRWVFPLAAWVYPVFVLYVTRKLKPLPGYFLFAFAAAVCCQISFWKFSSSNPLSPLFYLPAFLGFVLALPYLIDRLLYKRINGFLSALVFPLAYTAVDFLYAALSPFGSTGVLGYSQYGNLPLIQIVSITGIYGLTFLITWFGSVANWVLDNLSDISKVKKGAGVYCVIMIMVLAFGSVRLLIPPPQGTVRVSGIHVYDLRGEEGKALWKSSETDWQKFRQMSQNIENRLFKATVREARAGSKIIVWSEISPPVAKEDEGYFIKRAKEVSLQERIYLVASPFVEHKNPNEKDENKLMIFNPSGQLVLIHYKYGGNFIEGTVKGNKIIRSIQTEYGRLSGIICWDQDFPNTVLQTGLKKVDILAAPTADWREIDPIHTVVGYFRSIENGYSLIRESVNGLSIISDSKGRILSSMDHYTSTEWTMTAQVSMKGTFTLYPVIGDLFSWLSIISLLILACYSRFLGSLLKRKTAYKESR